MQFQDERQNFGRQARMYRRFIEIASDFFFKVQAAWTRDMGSARDLLTPEMHATLQKQCDQLRAAGPNTWRLNAIQQSP